MIQYFHELTKEEFNALTDTDYTWAECAKDYPQPIWCGYPDAVCGMMGCWSLMAVGDYKISRRYCKTCDCYIKRSYIKKIMAKGDENGS